jgi:hypothetical protein
LLTDEQFTQWVKPEEMVHPNRWYYALSIKKSHVKNDLF